MSVVYSLQRARIAIWTATSAVWHDVASRLEQRPHASSDAQNHGNFLSPMRADTQALERLRQACHAGGAASDITRRCLSPLPLQIAQHRPSSPLSRKKASPSREISPKKSIDGGGRE